MTKSETVVETTLPMAPQAAKRMPWVLSGDYNSVCRIVGFGGSNADQVRRFWIIDPSAGLTNVRSNVVLSLWDAFKDNGISIPFPQRDVRVVNDAVSVQVQQEGH